MIALILAGGFGTRMAGVIGDRPKALVSLGGRTLLDHLLARVRALPDIERIVLVSNARFHPQFLAWRDGVEGRAEDVLLLDDGARSAVDRLGAIGDLAFALDRLASHDDLLLLGSDNLLGFSLQGMVAAFRRSGCAQLGVRLNPDAEDRRRRGNLELDGEGRVTAFVEKPANPVGPWSATPLYVLPAAVLERVPSWLAAGGDGDALGSFTEWLHARETIMGWQLPGPLLDVGNPDSLAEAQRRISAEPERFAD